MHTFLSEHDEYNIKNILVRLEKSQNIYTSLFYAIKMY